MYGTTLVTDPVVEPLTLRECKDHLGITQEDTANDGYILALITAAREYAEQQTGRAFITQTWDYTFDTWPVTNANALYVDGTIYLPMAPIQSVTSVKYRDQDGTQQTWSSSNYTVSTSKEPCEIRRNYQTQWPIIRYQPDAIVIRFVAGYGDTGSSVPRALRQAMLLLVGHWFDQRNASTDKQYYTAPHAADALLTTYSVGDEFHQYGANIA